MCDKIVYNWFLELDNMFIEYTDKGQLKLI